LSTNATTATPSIDLNDSRLTNTQVIDPNADAYAKPKREPHFYQRHEDGSWGLPAWLSIALAESAHGDVQRAFADELMTYPGFELRGDAAASCHHAWFPQKECANLTPDGKKHMVVLAKTHCEMPNCPHCQDERERLDYFMARDKGDFWSACSEIISNCERDGIKPMVARIRLSVAHAHQNVLMMRQNQDRLHTHIRNWRTRLTTQHNIPSSHYGMVLSDMPSMYKAEVWVLYIGPEIPFESLRDNWKQVAGVPSAKFWHSRRSGIKTHDIKCHQEEFEGMMEAELQTIFTVPSWMRTAPGPTRAAMQVAFTKFRFIRQAGLFYGYRQPIDTTTIEEADALAEQALPVSDEALYELCNVPATEVDCCVHCRSPLVLPQFRRTGHLHDFHETYDHVSLHTRRARRLHKHISVSMCGEESRKYAARRALWASDPAPPPS
jgi:hypothetical protein